MGYFPYKYNKYKTKNKKNAKKKTPRKKSRCLHLLDLTLISQREILA